MKLKNITPVAAAVALAVGSMALTTEAQAGVSGSIGVSNFYLWRGADASGSAQVFGEVKYSHESGAYAAAWLSNSTVEGVAGNENNYYAGYAMKAGEIDLDFSYWNIVNPTVAHASNSTIFNTNATEFVAGIGFGDISGSIVLDIDPDHEDKYKYLSVGYSKDKYSVMLGKWMGDKDKQMMTYGHVTASYAVADELSFTVSKAFGDDGAATNKELLANITYTKSFETK